MKTATVDSYPIDILIAGDLDTARTICREYCMDTGFCVHVLPATYIYTGGEEPGVRVGLIHYPRFPTSPLELFRRARNLGDRLLAGLCQHSYTIQAPDKTLWVSRRPETHG